MSKSHGSKNPSKRHVSIRKNMSTQTDETDPSKNKNTIEAAFNRQMFNKWKGHKSTSAKKSIQTGIVRPKFESTPMKVVNRNESSDTDCEVLIDNVTPIRMRCKNFRSLVEGSDSQKEQAYRMSKSDGNVLSEICNSPGMRKMLSLDETLLKSIDLESFEANSRESGKEASLPLSPVPNKTGNQSPKEVLEVPETSNIVIASSKTQRNENAFRSDKNAICMPPPLPVTKHKIKPSKFPQGSQNVITVTADVHCSDLSNINIDNWADDSFMDGVLNRNTNRSKNQCSSDVIKNIPVKRPIICDDKNPGLKKKMKDTNANFSESREKHKNVHKESEQEIEEYHSTDESTNYNRNELLVVQNLQLPKVDKTYRTNEEINKKLAEKLVHINNAFDEKENSVMKNDFTRLSVGEKMRRMLVTNAQKPVTSRNKSVDISASIPDFSESFNELGPFFGLPSKVKILFERNKGISKLYEWQEECLNLNAVKEKKNLVYALPTSGGKTLVAEVLLLRELLCCKKNALFVLPYVAIVQEKVNSLSPFAFDLGFMVEEYAAGKGQFPPKKHRHKPSVYVATIEKAYSLINSLIETKRLSEIGLVIVDELHLLGEEDRGATLECLLTLLLFSSEKIHIVGMSATIGNLEEIAKFLQAEIYLSNFRPVELKEYVKCEDTLWAVSYREEELFTKARTIEPPYNAFMNKVDPDKICSLVLEVVPEFSCLVFCPTKSNCENVASLFVKIMPSELLNFKREERNALLRALFNDGKGAACPVLQKCIPYGVAYHHSGLTGDERRLLEEAYRMGTLSCICCTSTLAAGVNLPAKRVILRAPYVGCNFISRVQYKQMVGRAGRAGFDVAGESILICQKRDMPQVTGLLTSQVEGASSRLHLSESRGLQSLVLGCIGLGIATCRRDLHKMVACTLLYVQRKKLNVNPKQFVDVTISKLFKLGGLKVDYAATLFSLDFSSSFNTSGSSEQIDHTLNITNPAVIHSNATGSGSKPKSKRIDISQGTHLKISRLGIAAMKGAIDLNRANELYQDLLQAQASVVLLSHLHLLYLVTPYDMMDKIKIDPGTYFHVYSELNKKDQQTANIIGITNACMLKIMKGSKSNSVPDRVVRRFYITLILNDLWNHNDVWDVSRKYCIPRGTIQALMVSSSSFASCVLHFCEELSEFWAFKELLSCFTLRLSHCCSPDLAPLMDLPAVKMGRARQLYNAGYKTLIDIANANASVLVSSIDHMPRKVANEIIAAANLLLLTKADNLREEAEDLLDGLFSKSHFEYENE